MQTGSSKWLVIALAIGVVTVGLTDATLRAQQPAQQPAQAKPMVLPYEPASWGTPEGKRELNQKKARAASHLRSDTAMSSAQQAELREYYEGYVFRGFTRPENFGELPEWRSTLLLDFRNARNQGNHDFMAQITFNAMKALAEGNYYPATRVNAMLVIAGLNASEATPRDRVPVPYGPALDYLRSQVQSASQLDAVKIAALVGIHRHAEFQWQPNHPRIPQNVRDQLASEMLTIANQETAPDGRDPTAHDWMRTRAVDILAALAYAGPNGEIYQAFEKIVGNRDNSPLLRCSAAYAMGRLDYRNVNADATAAARRLGSLAAQACNREIDYLMAQEKLAKQKKLEKSGNLGFSSGAGGMESGMGGPEMGGPEMGGGGPGMMGPPGMAGPPGMMGPPGMGSSPGMGSFGAAPGSNSLIPEYKLDGSRRRLRYQLHCALTGIKGAGDQAKGISQLATAEPATTVVDDIRKAVEAALAVTDTKPLDKDPLVKDLREKLAKLEELTAEAAEAAQQPTQPAEETPDTEDLPPGA